VTIKPTVTRRSVFVMAFPPPDGREAVRTLECGNAGLEGEHPQKRA
jgi:hypothetical protein